MKKEHLIPWIISISIFFTVVLFWAFIGKKGIESIEKMIEGSSPPLKITKGEAEALIVDQQRFFNYAAEAAQPAVVNISVLQGAQGKDVGSGVIINPQGFVLTAASIVEKGGNIKITRFDPASSGGHTHIYDARIISVFPSAGIAVLKIETQPIAFNPFGRGIAWEPQPSASFAFPNSLRLGDWCLAMFYPLGRKQIVTSGIISTLNQTKTLGNNTYHQLIHTNAITKHNSIGGPLVNGRGEVIGIIIDKEYAVSIDQARMILNSMDIRL